MNNIYDFAIIGGGPTGYSAAMYAGRLGLKTIIFTGITPGGLIITTEQVENYPGFKSINGYELFERIRSHAKEYKIEEMASEVVGVEQGFFIKTKKETVQARTILFATGSQYRKLPLPEAAQFEGKGIHYCALCDGFAYKGKVVAVVGGGDGAAKEAIELAQHVKRVYVIVRGDQLRAEPINQKKIKEHSKIDVILGAKLTKIIGKDRIEAIGLDKLYRKKHQLEVDGIFLAIGHLPRSGLAAQLGVKLNQKKEIIINRYGETNLAGVYAAGDVADTSFKQLIVGCAEGVVATYKAYEYLR